MPQLFTSSFSNSPATSSAVGSVLVEPVAAVFGLDAGLISSSSSSSQFSLIFLARSVFFFSFLFSFFFWLLLRVPDDLTVVLLFAEGGTQPMIWPFGSARASFSCCLAVRNFPTSSWGVKPGFILISLRTLRNRVAVRMRRYGRGKDERMKRRTSHLGVLIGG